MGWVVQEALSCFGMVRVEISDSGTFAGIYSVSWDLFALSLSLSLSLYIYIHFHLC